MRSLALIFLISFLISLSLSQDLKQYPEVKTFVPPGWKIIQTASGDLNNDRLNDVVLVIENGSRENFKKNESLGAETLNLNPRKLLIAFKENQKLKVVLENNGFLPSEHDEESTCLEDPLADGGIEIKNGLLKIGLHYWYSCGTWYVNHDIFSFRFQGNRFKLIGLDSFEFHRASGESSEVSINYTTGRKKVTKGMNEFKNARPKVRWEKIKVGKLYDLEGLKIDSVLPDKQIEN